MVIRDFTNYTGNGPFYDLQTFQDVNGFAFRAVEQHHARLTVNEIHQITRSRDDNRVEDGELEAVLHVDDVLAHRLNKVIVTCDLRSDN